MSRAKKLTLTALITVVLCAIGAVVWIFLANRVDFTEERVTIAGPRGELHAVLSTPSGSTGPYGLVVFVHGDGPADADRDEAYRPLWDAFAHAGFATLSWDKPGVNNAPGNWLNQSMHDRATEVEAAIAWAHTRSDLDATRIGAWGISQAGWVLPEVAARRPDLRFMILVGPAINWLRQGEYNLRQDLKASGADSATVSAELDRRARQLALLNSGAGYREYVASAVDAPDPMSADRWGFVQRNFRADATRNLRNVRIPTLLIVGGRDRNVDVAETESVYRSSIAPKLLTVRAFPNATHSMTREDIEYNANGFEAVGRAVFAPKSIYVPGYLDTLRVFAKRQAE